jgi:hypothetical protein
VQISKTRAKRKKSAPGCFYVRIQTFAYTVRTGKGRQRALGGSFPEFVIGGVIGKYTAAPLIRRLEYRQPGAG